MSNNLKKYIPMWLTYSRIIIMPIIIFLIVSRGFEECFIATILFWFASLTDYLDGKLARKFGVVSSLGKFMDPIADKILVSGVLIALVAYFSLSPILVIILISRDIFIDGIRSAAAVDQIVIAAKPFGKWKTGLQMLAIPGLFFQISITDKLTLIDISTWTLWASVVLSLVSGGEYVYGYLKNKSPKNSH